MDTHFPNPFIIRDTHLHSQGKSTVIRDSRIIIKPNFQKDVKETMRANCKKIINLTIRFSRRQCGVFSLAKYLPVEYIRVFIYDTDKRKRDLTGLTPELVATIEVNTSKRIRTMDILNGTVEQHGKYRIVWYQNWRGNITPESRQVSFSLKDELEYIFEP
jgi:hypothetical protein